MPAFVVDEQSVVVFVDVARPAAAFVAAVQFVAVSAAVPVDVVEPSVVAFVAVPSAAVVVVVVEQVVAAAAAVDDVVVAAVEQVVVAVDAFGFLDHGRHVPHCVPHVLVDQSLQLLA